ncbi:dehydrogenase/reductase SDR family member 8 precursor [Periconia macrospinosa]|uniref:Short-chain dehydrogenase/reductase 3 n=1 Tax=Periconia macrospinosa TaxID=97972 RepID=A0A2V1EDL4_9PLEO|nr:dehydrogenase/reductase SDR family member 8 precursor [Periconia macrospinosa]
MSTRSVNATVASLTRLSLNPVVVASFLWALTRGPASFRYRLVNTFTSLRDPSTYAQFVKTLKWILAIRVAGIANGVLNKLALNSWRLNNEKSRWDFRKEVAVITGGCSGIGALVTKRLINKGVKVAVLDIQQLPPELQGYANIRFFACDITKASDVNSAANSVRETLGAPSILINNAGTGGCRTIMNTDPEALRKVMDVNLLSHWYTVQAFVPSMIEKNKGHIMTIASSASYLGLGGMTDYCATKAGVLAFHEGLNQELRIKYKAPNVLTTIVHPTWSKTPLIKPFEESLKAAGNPLLEPSFIADAIADRVFTCSGGQIFLPDDVSRATGIRFWPSWLQEKVRESHSRMVLRGAL